MIRTSKSMKNNNLCILCGLYRATGLVAGSHFVWTLILLFIIRSSSALTNTVGLGRSWFCSPSSVLLSSMCRRATALLLLSSSSGSRFCRERKLTSTCFIADSSYEEDACNQMTRKSFSEADLNSFSVIKIINKIKINLNHYSVCE